MKDLCATDVTLAILAGGQGRRMGFPKQNLEIANQPILEYLLNKFAWPGPTLLVTAPGCQPAAGAHRFDAQAADSAANQGPLQGILTALENAKTEYIIITTVDMPALEPWQLVWLVERLIAQPELHGLMCQRTIDGKLQIEPFPFACQNTAAPIVAGCLARRQRSVHSLAKLPGFALRVAPESWPILSWTNLNSPIDFQAFIRSVPG